MNKMNQMTHEEYREWIFNPANSHNCAECPHENGFDSWPGDRLPCGQFNCWVDIHCNRSSEDEED